MPVHLLRSSILLGLVAMVASGCASSASLPTPAAATLPTNAPPTATSLPATALPPTATSLPATATAAPTAVPVTATVTAESAPRALILTQIGEVQVLPVNTDEPASDDGPPSGDGPLVLTTLPTSTFNVALSPNGALIAYQTEGELRISTLATGAEMVIGAVETGLADLNWSPDSSRLLYAVDTGNPVTDVQPQLWLATLDGQPPVAIGNGFAPAWSPDGTRIAFVGAPFEGSPPFGGGPGGVAMLANADGSEPRTVGSETIYPGWQPLVWSADGTRFAAGNEVIDAASGAVAFRPSEGEHTYISGIHAIAPDGRAVGIWRSLRIGDPDSAAGFVEQNEVVLVREDGEEQRLAITAKEECPCLAVAGQITPAWTADGSTIVVPLPNESVQLFDNAGHLQRSLPLPEGVSFDSEGVTVDPDPSGRFILAELVRFEDGELYGEVWLFAADGTPPQWLANGTALGWLP